jgi:hypothetical protein
VVEQACEAIFSAHAWQLEPESYMRNALRQRRNLGFVDKNMNCRPILILAASLAGSVATQAQVTISSSDMFNQPGQYYRAYSNGTNTVPVSTLLGTTGGPQAWDFSTGPTDATYRFNYIPAAQGTDGAQFVALGAQVAEQKIDESNTNVQSFLYFKQDTTAGRIDYGFYDPSFSAAQPAAFFTNGLQDFPASIHYGGSWSGNTVFESIYSDPVLGDYPMQVTYSALDNVDAYGLVVLPNLGFLDCLRVHELVTYDIAVDFGLGGGYEQLGTQYALNYYWLSPAHGIVVQISASDSTPPPDSMPSGASAFARMFELYHPAVTNPPPVITGFKITMGPSAALLQWTRLTGVSSYRVDYATTLGPVPNWQPLGTTTSNFLLDPAAVSPNNPRRYYRLVGTF